MLSKQESKLQAARMHIYVRRGGPNYQKGLAKMRTLGQEIGIPIEVLVYNWNLKTFLLPFYYTMLQKTL